ncbi:MAG: hypothetical protein JWO31_2273, partial [Phycisphaerales bacterium]|nr:hypothetical protein [Phycisphaerales bacterium]
MIFSILTYRLDLVLFVTLVAGATWAAGRWVRRTTGTARLGRRTWAAVALVAA